MSKLEGMAVDLFKRLGGIGNEDARIVRGLLQRIKELENPTFKDGDYLIKIDQSRGDKLIVNIGLGERDKGREFTVLFFWSGITIIGEDNLRVKPRATNKVTVDYDND